MGKKLHPSSDLRSRMIMGTYGTGKSHLALVLLNFFAQSFETPQLQIIVDKLEPDTQMVLKQYRSQIPRKFLIVNLYGDEGDIADALMMGLKQALEREGLVYLLPPSAFDAALKRIKEIEDAYAENFAILKEKVQENGMSVDELKTRLEQYQKKAFDLFREIHPLFSAGGRFEYTTMLTPTDFYTSVAGELIEKHDFSGIAVFWDEFGHKMGEVVKDPTGKEGLILQEFAECCNDSRDNQLHFYIFCHRSLKEYHDISMATSGNQLEEDLRKIEGRFKPYMMKSTDVETFQLIDAVIVADEKSDGWNRLTQNCREYFEKLVQETAQLRFFTGFTPEELKATVVLGTYPLHPMAVYSLPAISEKVAQNNRTLFTCLCEDEHGSFKRFLDKALYRSGARIPPMFTVDNLWDYFSSDVKQQERFYSIYRDFEHLRARLSDDDMLGLRILKAVSVFRVTSPTRVKVTGDTLAYSLNVPVNELDHFEQELDRHSDLRNENHILMKLQADGSYRPAVSSATESLMEKVRKLLNHSPEKLGQSPVQYLKSLWKQFGFIESYEATSYGDDFGVVRKLEIEPISMNQLKESLHILTKNLGSGSFMDGILLVVFCSNSNEIEVSRQIAASQLSQNQYQQVIIAIPKEPVQLFALLREHQALAYLRKNEASLYAEGGELHEEWSVYDNDRSTQLKDTVDELFAPERQMLDYFWLGQSQNIMNTRQIKKLASSVMNTVFPDCPIIGEPKLTLDDFGGNWGYRKDCRDITIKFTRKDAAEKLWEETAAAPKHIITQILKSNKILRKNQAGDCILEKPDPESHNGAFKTWQCIEKYIQKARQAPLRMELMVRALRKPPFGVKCRVMPIIFAAVAHKELVYGNISFEFQRTATQIEKITAIENDTLEKVFTSPEKYKLVYVNVSSNQNALISALSRLYNVDLLPSDPPLERVKKVGIKMGEWWRSLPKHAQLTDEISDGASLLKEYVFKPLAAHLLPDTQQILLKDIFEHVFDDAKKITPKQVEDGIRPFKEEFERLLENLKSRIFDAFGFVFGQTQSPDQELASWFSGLSGQKRNYTYNGEPAILINICRERDEINPDTLLKIAGALSGLDIESWGDDLVLFFQGKLDGAKKYIDTFIPPIPVPPPEPDPVIRSDQAVLSMFSDGKKKERIFDVSQDISSNGQVLENMLNSTIEQLGKGMDEKEKTIVLCRIIEKHIFRIKDG